MMNNNLFPHLSAAQPPSPGQKFPSNSQDCKVTCDSLMWTKSRNLDSTTSQVGFVWSVWDFFLILVSWFQPFQNFTKTCWHRLILCLGTTASLRARCFIGCIKNSYCTLCDSCFISTYEQFYWPCMKFSCISQKGFSLLSYSWLLWPCFSSRVI